MLRYVRNQIIHIADRRNVCRGSRKKLRKLEMKVKRLESKVEQLEKRTNESYAYRVASWLLVLLEIAVAVVTLIVALS